MGRRSKGSRAAGRVRAVLVTLVALLALAAAAAAALAWVAWRWVDAPLPLAAPTVAYTVAAGSTPRAVAAGWSKSGVDVDPRWLYAWFRLSGDASRIRAGHYEIAQGTTPRRLLEVMVQGLEALERVRLPEGQTLREWRAVLAASPHLVPDSAALDERALMAALDAPGLAAEGRFFPDTYAFPRGTSDLVVLRQAFDAMQRELQAAWDARAEGLPLASADEALILASIVEKETGRDEDRARIAGVFVNRLRIGMRLQTDPTVIYGLGESFDGNLRKRDLLADGPYNTYTRAGLPPTPIAMPSLASLRAAVRPARTRAMYFVARGDGHSVFSETLGEHNRAVDRYQRGLP
ncbi:MAG: endolytic transglycosylase MltG [Rhodoferax sp.]|nr:endolytic transglycosylase MltG [Rhodoferax sp.]MCP5290818.1 endolytic transglycosylase MltG [Burkholderiaceae bacterium]